MDSYKKDMTKLMDSMGRPLTQSLFLELGYDPKAIFTLGDNDKERKGKFYFSLKKLYLEFEDPLEIHFAKNYLASWRQWQRMADNAMIKPHIDQWREELELQIRSSATKTIIEMALDEKGGFQANKWLADKGWITRTAGRPSNEEVQEELVKQTKIRDTFSEDLERLTKH